MSESLRWRSLQDDLAQVTITADNQGPLLAIATWFLMVTMILAVIFRVAIRLINTSAPGIEDTTISLALFFGIAQSIAVSLGLKNGLGQTSANLTPAELGAAERAFYASNLLYIISIALTKISVLQLLERLAVSGSHKRIATCMMVATIIWALVAFLVLALQCGTIMPWSLGSGHCIGIFSFWAVTSLVDIGVEMVIIALPFLMMIPVQVAISRKAIIVIAFVFRVVVVTAVILRLYSIHILSFSEDWNLSMVNTGITTQCVISISIMTACIPCLKPFLDGFDSGMLNISLQKRGASGLANSYRMRNMILERPLAPRGKNRLGYSVTVAASDANSLPQRQGSLSISSTKSDQMIIKRVQEWTVRHSRRQSLKSHLADLDESCIEPRAEFKGYM